MWPRGVGKDAMITACIHAWSAHRHNNVNGRRFNQTGMIMNKKYALLLLVGSQILPRKKKRGLQVDHVITEIAV